METRNATFMEWAMVHVAIGSKGGHVRTKKTRLRFHWGLGLTSDGKVLTKPFMKRTVAGCVKIAIFLPPSGGML